MSPELDVTIHIDRNLGVQISKSLSHGCTIADLKRQIAEDDPTGQTRPQDFVLSAAAWGPVADEQLVTEELGELELRPVDSAGGWQEPDPAIEAGAAERGAQEGGWPEPDQAAEASATEEPGPQEDWGGWPAPQEDDGWPEPGASEANAAELARQEAAEAPALEPSAQQQQQQQQPPAACARPPEGVAEAPAPEARAQQQQPPEEQAQQLVAGEEPPEPRGAEETPERKLFAMLDRSSKGAVSQRDVLVALRKHPPVRKLFGLPVADGLEKRLLAIQDAFEAGKGLGEIAHLFDELRGDTSGQTFSLEQFLAKCQKGRFRTRVREASALFHREHSTNADFVATHEWAIVPEGAACPGGLEYKMDMETGKTMARLPSRTGPPAKAGPGAGAAAAAPAQTAPRMEDGGPAEYRTATASLFIKRSDDPASGKISKLKIPQGTTVHSTGRVWIGPSGGRWAELDPSRGADSGWVLIIGPGFGLTGPALVDAKEPLPVVEAEGPEDELPPGQDYDRDFLGIRRGKCSKCKCGWYQSKGLGVGG